MTKNNLHRKWIALFFAVLIALSALPAVPAVAQETAPRRTVRVAFPEQAGMSYIGHSGKVSGYNYDYLEKISEFTGWDMEYIAYGSADGNEAVSAAIQDLQDGKVDLLGPMLKLEQTEDMFEYPENSYGTVYTTLCAPLTSTLRDSSLRAGQFVRVGLWEQAETRNAEVLNFLESENLSYQIYYYATQEEQMDALWAGNVDLVSSLSLSPITNTRIVEKFAARPYYFVSTKGNTELIAELDAAITEINRLQPKLQDNLFEEYFLSAGNAFMLSDAQQAALDKIGTLQVLCVDNDAPYVYEKDGKAQGAVVYALDEFARETGLDIHYTFCRNREEADTILSDHHFDILIGIPFTSSFCAEKGFVKSESILSSGMAYVRDSSTAFGKIGIVRGLEPLIDSSKFGEAVLFDNARQCIEALNDGIVDVVAGDRSVMEYYIYDTGSTYATSLIAGNSQNVCVAVAREQSATLLEILNNYIYSLSDYAKTAYLDMGNVHDESKALNRYVIHHPVKSLFVAGCMVALVVVVIMTLIYSAKMKRKNQELRHANEAKSRFLSRMSHDIRTPLNGIIGLLKIDEAHYDDTDLIKTNHKKMLVSANHLLSLINDVLQMSKLEDGRAELTHEPFSLAELSMDVGTIIGARMSEAGITLEVGKQELPVPYVYGSPLHLRQIFLNIYGNCIKYNKKNGKVSTSLECVIQV